MISDLKDAVDRLGEFYTPEETRLWIYASHPMLGGARPIELIHAGEAGRLLAVIESFAETIYT